MNILEKRVLNVEINNDDYREVILIFMMFIHVLNSSNISYKKLNINEKSEFDSAKEYLDMICSLINENKNKIELHVGTNNFKLVEEGIQELSYKYDYFNKIQNSISIVSNLNNDEIKSLVLNNDIFSGDFKDVTSNSVSKLVLSLFTKDKEINNIYDLGSGNGNFLIQVGKIDNTLSLYGSDVNFVTCLSSRIRMFLSGLNVEIKTCNALKELAYENKFDAGFVNFPFGYRSRLVDEDCNNLNKYINNIKIHNNLDWIFIDRVLQSLNKNGRAIAVIPNVSLTNILDRHQRENAIQKNYIEGVISLPENVLSYTPLKLSLIIFNLHKDSENVKFFDASELGELKNRKLELFVDEIVSGYYENAICITSDEIKKNDYTLLPSVYEDLKNIKLENEVLLETVAEDIFRGYQMIGRVEENNVIEGAHAYKIINVGDLQDGTFNVKTLKSINLEPKRAERYLVENGDVLISAKATTMKYSIAQIEEGEKIIASGSLIVVKCNQEKINPAYLVSFLNSTIGKKLVESLQSGLGIISINVSAFKKLRIPLIDKTKQDSIADKYYENCFLLRVLRNKLISLEKKIDDIFDSEYNGEYDG